MIYFKIEVKAVGNYLILFTWSYYWIMTMCSVDHGCHVLETLSIRTVISHSTFSNYRVIIQGSSSVIERMCPHYQCLFRSQLKNAFNNKILWMSNLFCFVYEIQSRPLTLSTSSGLKPYTPQKELKLYFNGLISVLFLFNSPYYSEINYLKKCRVCQYR